MNIVLLALYLVWRVECLACLRLTMYKHNPFCHMNIMFIYDTGTEIKTGRRQNFAQFNSTYKDLLQTLLYSKEVMLHTVSSLETECRCRMGNISNLHWGWGSASSLIRWPVILIEIFHGFSQFFRRMPEYHRTIGQKHIHPRLIHYPVILLLYTIHTVILTFLFRNKIKYELL
jgi:hypothetical protein